MDFTPAQRNAIDLPHNLVVTAGAGSGKTRVLVERYLRLLMSSPPDDNRAILAITFTEKAAREMRERVRAALQKRARAATAPDERAAWEAAYARIEAAPIGTIHSFCAALLRAQPAESRLDPQFAVLDEIEAGLLLRESIDAALSEAAQAADSSAIPQLLAEFSLDELRSLLIGLLQGGSEVRAAVAALPATPDDVQRHWQARLAAARAADLREMLASTAWRNACDTLQQLAPSAPTGDRIGSQVSTLAGWLASLVPPDDTDAPGATRPLPDLGPLTSINLQGGSKKAWGSADDLAAAKAALKALRTCCETCGALLLLQPDDELEQRAAHLLPGLCALYRQVQEHYTRRKQQQDALDFDDLEWRTRDLLESHPAVRARWQAEFQAILVDEFQDTNDEQRAIIYALAGIAPPTSPATPEHALPSLFVVGDGKQSIYRFRGADVSVFRAVQADMQAQGGRVLALATSFRTHPPLLAWINQVTQAIFARERALHSYEIPFEPLDAHRPAPDHTCCAELHIIEGASNAEEARSSEAAILAARIKELTTGAAGRLVYDEQREAWRTPDYGDIAILCQASTVFAYYEATLRAEGIPYLTTAGRGYYGRAEVQDLIHLLRFLNDPADELALVGVLRSPLFALDDATLLRLRFARQASLWDALLAADAPQPALAFARDTLRDLYALRGRLTVVELLRAALAQTGYLATISGLPDGAQRRVNVEKLVEAARRAGSMGLLAFGAYLEDLLRAEPREGEAPLEAEGSVRLMTIHRSKGLEFPIVVLPDLGRRPHTQPNRWLARRAYGLALRLRDDMGDLQNPIAYHLARQEEQRMEQAERERLLYVALTRARDYLLLSGPAATKSSETWLSRLLDALGCPWETGGPPAGPHGVVSVFR